MKTNAPIASTPTICTQSVAPAAMAAASVPHTPANRWAGTAPTTSSTLRFSSIFMPAVQMMPPMAPMITAQ